jgi:hypothetical protein
VTISNGSLFGGTKTDLKVTPDFDDAAGFDFEFGPPADPFFGLPDVETLPEFIVDSTLISLPLGVNARPPGLRV